MQKWKHRFKHLLVLILTVSLVGGSVNAQKMSVAAEEITGLPKAASDTGGVSDAETPVEGGASGEVKTSDTDGVGTAGTVTGVEEGSGGDGVGTAGTVSGMEEGSDQEKAANPSGNAASDSGAAPEVLVGDFSQWIIQEGGFPAVGGSAMMTAAEGEISTQAEADWSQVEALLLAGCRERKESIDVSGCNISTEEIGAVVSQCINYNPELFYVAGVSYSYNPSTGMVTSVKVTYDEKYPPEEVEKYNQALEKAYAEAIPDEAGMSDVQKARALHDYLAQHVEYDTSYTNRNAYNALIEGKVVCQGYSLAYAALLKRAGIEVDYCMASESMNHMWNYVKIDGEWYHVDVTWDDPTVDRVGYVRYNYFLVSDAKMSSEGTKGHHDWTVTQKCNNTKYDNAFWQQNAQSAIFYVGGAEYYLRAESGSTQQVALICRKGDQETVQCTVPGVWSTWGGGGYWPGIYSRLSYYNGKLYFNDTTNIYAIVPGEKQPKVVYTYEKGDGYLYGSLVCDNMITLGVAQDPNTAATRIKVPLPEEPVPVEPVQSVAISAEPKSLVYGYQNPSVLTAQVTLGEGVEDAVTYQWYQVSGSGSGESETAITGATAQTYTMEKNLNAGTYHYRVKATAADCTKEADITIEIAKAEGKISNKASGGYGLEYTYQGTPIAGPKADQFESSSTQLTFIWYQGSAVEGNQLDAAPVNAGSYVLRVKAAATENVKEAVLDLAVTVKKADLTVSPKPQTITYGESIEESLDQVNVSGLQPGDQLTEISLTTQDKNVTATGSIQAAKAVIKNAAQQDVSANYDITYGTGTLTILKSTPTLQISAAYAVQKIYDGTAFVLPSQAELALTGAVYGDVDFAWYQDANGSRGDKLTAAPMDAGSYWIVASIAESENTAAAEAEKKVEITPASYEVTVAGTQNILMGVGAFTEPTFTNAKDEEISGLLTYTYDNLTNAAYEEVQKVLAGLEEGTSGKISYTFTPDSKNYAGTKTGEINFVIKDIEFLVNGETATEANTVTLKADPVYGDDWSEIVKIGTVTARAGEAADSQGSHFTLDVTGKPGAGNGQSFRVLYNGTLNGKVYQNVEVCSGKVDVARRTITVSAGSYRVSKVYDGTVSAGTASGALEISNVLAADQNVKVMTAPVNYQNPNVGGQAVMTVSLTLEGDEDGNYELAGASLEVPCEILPKAIIPVLEVTGTYQYTGSAIIPVFTVKDGTVQLTDTDYSVTYENNINAGEGKVSVYAEAGGNYTWNGAVSATFVIEKIAYQGPKTATTLGKYGNSVAFDLTELLPEGYKTGNVQVTDEDHILSSMPVIRDSVMSCQLVNDRTKVNKTATVTIPVTETTNYHGFDVVIIVQMTDKISQTNFGFEKAHQSIVYGAEDFTIAASGAAQGSMITYGSSNPSIATVDATGKIHILGAGTVQITAVASETPDYISATAFYTLNIAPKELQWDVSGLTAVDKAGTITDQRASLFGALKVSGILDQDASEAIFDCAADRLAGVYDGVTPGSHMVTLSWADAGQPVRLTGARAGNYILPMTLPEIGGKINAVSDNQFPQPEAAGNMQYKLEVEQGVSGIAQALKQIEHLNTPAKIEAQLWTCIQKTVNGITGSSLAITENSLAIYDVTLFYHTGSQAWQKATTANFPREGLTMTIPYPAGTGPDTNDYIVTHLFTEDMFGYRAGDVEYPEVTKTEDGIRFVVHGLSPIAVGWTEAGKLGNLEDLGEEEEDDDEPANETVTGAQGQGGPALSPPTGEDEGRNVFALIIPALSLLGIGMFLFGKCRKMK